MGTIWHVPIAHTIIIPTVKCEENHSWSLAIQYNNNTYWAYYMHANTAGGHST